MTRRAIAGVLVVSALLGPSVARAAPTEAETALAQGVVAFKHHDYESARRSFQRSYDLTPRTSTLLNLGLAELNSDHPLDAIRHLRAFVRAPDAPAAKVEEVRANIIPRAESLLGRIEIDAPIGAQVVLDGVTLGNAPLSEPVDVPPGDHEIAASFNDGRSTRTTVNATAGELAHAHLVIAEPTLPKPVAPATTSPREPLQEPTGGPRWSTSKKATVIVLGSAAVASLAIGTVFHFVAKSNESDADSYRAGLAPNACAPPAGQPIPSNCALLRDASNAETTHDNLATGFYIGGAALAVGAVASWLLWPSATQKDAHAWVLPMIGRSNGVAFGASF